MCQLCIRFRGNCTGGGYGTEGGGGDLTGGGGECTGGGGDCTGVGGGGDCTGGGEIGDGDCIGGGGEFTGVVEIALVLEVGEIALVVGTELKVVEVKVRVAILLVEEESA